MQVGTSVVAVPPTSIPVDARHEASEATKDSAERDGSETAPVFAVACAATIRMAVVLPHPGNAPGATSACRSKHEGSAA